MSKHCPYLSGSRTTPALLYSPVGASILLQGNHIGTKPNEFKDKATQAYILSQLDKARIKREQLKQIAEKLGMVQEIVMTTLDSIIKETLQENGMVPVKFDVPLKHVVGFVKLIKHHNPETLADQHAIVGWGLGNLIEQLGKELFRIKKVSLTNNDSGVDIEALVVLVITTIEEDHESYFRGCVDTFAGTDFKQHGYFYEPRYYHWDSAEIVGELRTYIQMDGSGAPE